MTAVLDEASARAEDDAPPSHQIAIRGVVAIREFLADPSLSRAEIRSQGRKFHHIRNAQIITDDARARELIREYGALVRSIASEAKYNIHRQVLIDRDDMYAIGCTIMIQSVEMFDESRGAKLSTWIGFRVRQGLMAVVKELHGSLRENGGRTARGEELNHAKGGEPPPKVHIESLSDHITGRQGEQGEITVLDTIASEDDPPDERMQAAQERAWLIQTIEEVCTPIERDVVYRILAGETGESIGARHGHSRQRVDQIHQRAIEKLQRRRRIEDVQRERALRSPSA